MTPKEDIEPSRNDSSPDLAIQFTGPSAVIVELYPNTHGNLLRQALRAELVRSLRMLFHTSAAWPSAFACRNPPIVGNHHPP